MKDEESKTQENQVVKQKIVPNTTESPKKGMWSWLSGKKAASTEAYLGESNKYVR